MRKPILLFTVFTVAAALGFACAEAGTSDSVQTTAAPIPIGKDASPKEAPAHDAPPVVVTAAPDVRLLGDWWICNGGDFDRLVRLRTEGGELIGEVVRTDGSVDPSRGFRGPYDPVSRVWTADLLDDLCFAEPCPTWMRVTFDTSDTFLSGVDFAEHAVSGARHDGKFNCPAR